MTTATLIDLSVRNANQSWVWQEIRKYDGHTLRANIRRNAYDDQSFANIEVFSPTAGWLVIASHPVSDFPCADVSYTQRDMSDAMGDKFFATTQDLFRIGEQFFGL